MATRDWVMIGIGFTVAFFIFSSIGRKAMMTAMGVAESEAERLLAKVEAKAKERAKGK